MTTDQEVSGMWIQNLVSIWLKTGLDFAIEKIFYLSEWEVKK